MNDFIFSLSLRLEAFNLLKVISFTSIFQGFSLVFNVHLYGSPELMYIYKYKFKYMYICNIYIYIYIFNHLCHEASSKYYFLSKDIVPGLPRFYVIST